MKVFILIFVMTSSIAQANRTYTSNIEKLQVEGLSDAYNTIYLEFNVTDSPCSNTNSNDRFAISNSHHQAAALAAVVADKEIGLMPSGVCNSANIEGINYITIRPNR